MFVAWARIQRFEDPRLESRVDRAVETFSDSGYCTDRVIDELSAPRVELISPGAFDRLPYGVFVEFGYLLTLAVVEICEANPHSALFVDKVCVRFYGNDFTGEFDFLPGSLDSDSHVERRSHWKWRLGGDEDATRGQVRHQTLADLSAQFEVHVVYERNPHGVAPLDVLIFDVGLEVAVQCFLELRPALHIGW